jgi:hypothetical protein
VVVVGQARRSASHLCTVLTPPATSASTSGPGARVVLVRNGNHSQVVSTADATCSPALSATPAGLSRCSPRHQATPAADPQGSPACRPGPAAVSACSIRKQPRPALAPGPQLCRSLRSRASRAPAATTRGGPAGPRQRPPAAPAGPRRGSACPPLPRPGLSGPQGASRGAWGEPGPHALQPRYQITRGKTG